MNFLRLLTASMLAFSLFSCPRQRPVQSESLTTAAHETYFSQRLSDVLSNAQLPENIAQSIQESFSKEPAFIPGLFACLQGDPFLRILVDKEHPLAESYEPADLTELNAGSYKTGRTGLTLRSAAADALDEMGQTAKAEGLTLTASSAFRSYAYQAQVYTRNVREMGQQAADRESARPGHSQHQLGLVADFGSIDDSFAQTKEGVWLAANASRFGWSLSYPQGYEDVTGYRWESWHYRYTGRELAEFIDNYFGGIQQYALRFIHEWEKLD